jgi:hypothetical protein
VNSSHCFWYSLSTLGTVNSDEWLPLKHFDGTCLCCSLLAIFSSAEKSCKHVVALVVMLGTMLNLVVARTGTGAACSRFSEVYVEVMRSMNAFVVRIG